MSAQRPDRSQWTYEQAMMAVQAGVGFAHAMGSTDREPKHLRVGIASAHVTDSALAMLLIDKGIISRAEYVEAVRLAAIREVEIYEDGLSRNYGGTVRLLPGCVNWERPEPEGGTK